MSFHSLNNRKHLFGILKPGKILQFGPGNKGFFSRGNNYPLHASICCNLFNHLRKPVTELLVYHIDAPVRHVHGNRDNTIRIL